MVTRSTRWTLLLLAVLPLAGGAQTSLERPSLSVGARRGPIHLDGRVDEPAWFGGDSIATLTMTEPVEGGVTTGRTVVRVLADAGALFIAVVAHDPAGELFVVYNHNVRDLEDRWEKQSNQLLVKLQYALRR